LAVLKPGGVVPLMRFEIADDGAGVGAQLGAEGVRVGFEGQKISVGAEDFIFVDGTLADFGKKKFPDAGRPARTHRVDAAVPVIHIANDADATRGRRPDGEARSGNAGDRVEVRAKFLVGVVVAALADEVEVEVRQEKRKRVWVEDFEAFAIMSAPLDFVAAGFGCGGLVGRPNGFEESFGAELQGIGDFCGCDRGVLEDDAGLGSPGNKKADSPTRADRVRAENAEWV